MRDHTKIEPELLKPDAAREFCGGCDPHQICEPIRLHTNRKYWSRQALQARIAELSAEANGGTRAPTRTVPGAADAFDAWKASADK